VLNYVPVDLPLHRVPYPSDQTNYSKFLYGHSFIETALLAAKNLVSFGR